MADRNRHLERTIWIAVVAVLATTLAWIAAISGTALLLTHALPAAQALAVLRALGHVALILVLRAWPALPVLAIGGMIAALVFGRTAPNPRKVRHA